LSGPKGCTQPDGYPDAALCTVPNENLKPPAVGESYIDPNLGASVKVMTGPGVYHSYSANNPLSAKNTYLMTYPSNGSCDVILAGRGRVGLRRIGWNGEVCENFFWDSYDDSVYYYPSGAAFIKHDLRTGLKTTIIDYSKDGHGFKSIRRGGTSGSSKDNWISFFAENEKQVCVLDLNSVTTYCADYGNARPAFGSIDYSLVSKGVDKGSGKRYVILVAKGASPGFYSVNLSTGKLDLEFRGPEDQERNGNHDGVCDPGEFCMNPSHSD